MANASILAAFERMWQHVNSLFSKTVQYSVKQELTKAQKAQARFNIGAAEIDDVYHNPIEEICFTWDGTSENKDTFVLTSKDDDGNLSQLTYCKVSDDIPNRNFIRNLNGTLYEKSDGSVYYNSEADNVNSSGEYNNFKSIIELSENLYSIGTIFAPLSFLFVEASGAYEWEDISFIAPSSGVYFPVKEDYVVRLTLTASYKTGIYLNAFNKQFVVKVNDSGSLQTVDKNNTMVTMATTNYVDEHIDSFTKVIALTQEEYDKLVANGEDKPNIVYMIVSGNA